MSTDGQITVEWQSKMGELLRNTQDLTKEISKTTAALKGQGKEAQDVGNIQSRLQAAAKKTWEETRTGAEKTAQKVAEVNALYKRGFIDLDTYGRRMGQLGGESSGAFGKLKEFAGSAAGSIVGTVTVVGTLTAAVRQIGKELEAIDARQKRAAGQQVGMQNAVGDIVMSLGKADMTPNQVIARIDDIAKKTNARAPALMEAAGNVLSARGNLEASTAMEHIEGAAALGPGRDSSWLGMIAGSSLDLRKKYGGTAKQNIGMIIAGMETSRVKDAEAFATNVVPALMGLSSPEYGLSAQEAIGLTSAMGSESGDLRGANSSTGSQNWIAQLNKALAGTDAPKTGLLARLEWLDTNPQGRRIHDKLVGPLGAKYDPELVKKANRGEKIDPIHGEASTLPAQLGFLQAGSPARRALENAIAATPTMDDAGGRFDANLAQQAEIGLLQVAKIHNAGVSAEERFNNDPERGRIGALKEALFKNIEASGLSTQVEKGYLEKLFSAQSAGDTAEGVSERAIGYLQEQIDKNTGAGFGGHLWNAATLGMGMSEQQLYGESEEQKRTNENLRELIAVMKEMRDSFRSSRTGGTNGPRPPKPGETP